MSDQWSVLDYFNPYSWFASSTDSSALARNAPDDKDVKELKTAVSGQELFNVRVSLKQVIGGPKELQDARSNLQKVRNTLEENGMMRGKVNCTDNWAEGSVTRELLEKYGKRW